MKSININELAEEMDLIMDDHKTFVDRKKGQVVSVSDSALVKAEEEFELTDKWNNLPDWQQDEVLLAVDILDHEENYVPLPDRFEINEYDMMEDFCFIIEDEKIKASMLSTMNGRGVFRRFKEKIINHGIADDWYNYKQLRFKDFAIKWCQKNEIDYDE